ncbi:cobalamin B12-binding domain-containing protein [Nocardioides houyundeii]|uniref:cobalamin B12-binding domain-containing protein n=1 Tax=Nocardioides houyundeii TaxID=2045452 RepID=UPI0013B3A090|nr:cobalamin-dependent protein [Nocardioides houyundeii]
MTEPTPTQLYDDEALQRLRAVADMVSSGWSPGQAAVRVHSRSDDPAGVPEPRPVTMGDPESLARVAVHFDVPGLHHAIESGFALGEFEDVVDGWLMPALGRLGAAWRDGRVSVAEEHFVSASVQRHLAVLFDQTPRQPGGPRVLLGLARGSRHELGVLAFAIALRRAGVDVVYLGGDVPTEAWLSAVGSRRPAAVVLAVPSPDDVLATREVVEAVTGHDQDLPIMVGGSHQDEIERDVIRLGHEIAPAARRMTDALLAKI